MERLIDMGKITNNLYWEQTACIREENMVSKYIKRRKSRMCFSSDQFNVYSKTIVRELENVTEFIIGDIILKISDT